MSEREMSWKLIIDHRMRLEGVLHYDRAVKRYIAQTQRADRKTRGEGIGSVEAIIDHLDKRMKE